MVGNDTSFKGIPWNFTNSNLEHIRNTCRMDCILTILFIHEQDLKGENKSLLMNLNDNHVLHSSFEYMNNGNYSMAREILSDCLFENNSENIQDECDWYGDINDAFQVFKDIVGCTFLVKKRCDGCGESVFRKRHSPSCMVVPFYNQSTNPNRLLCMFHDNIVHFAKDKDAIPRCVKGKRQVVCKGSSHYVSKKLLSV